MMIPPGTTYNTQIRNNLEKYIFQIELGTSSSSTYTVIYAYTTVQTVATVVRTKYKYQEIKNTNGFKVPTPVYPN